MSKQRYQTLFAYSQHTAQRLLDQAARLDDAAQRAQPGDGHGSIYDIFFHLLSVSHGWRVALATGQQPARLQSGDYATLAAVGAALAQEYAAWQTYLAGLDDTPLDETLFLTSARGDKAALIHWRVLQHLVLHFMQHHTEIAQLLTNQGQSPGDIDFLFYRG